MDDILEELTESGVRQITKDFFKVLKKQVYWLEDRPICFEYAAYPTPLQLIIDLVDLISIDNLDVRQGEVKPLDNDDVANIYTKFGNRIIVMKAKHLYAIKALIEIVNAKKWEDLNNVGFVRDNISTYISKIKEATNPYDVSSLKKFYDVLQDKESDLMDLKMEVNVALVYLTEMQVNKAIRDKNFHSMKFTTLPNVFYGNMETCVLSVKHFDLGRSLAGEFLRLVYKAFGEEKEDQARSKPNYLKLVKKDLPNQLKCNLTWGDITAGYETGESLVFDHPDPNIEKLPVDKVLLRGRGLGSRHSDTVPMTEKQYAVNLQDKRKVNVEDIPYMASQAFRVSVEEFSLLQPFLSAARKRYADNHHFHFTFTEVTLENDDPESVLKVVSIHRIARVFKTMEDREGFKGASSKENTGEPLFYVLSTESLEGTCVNWKNAYDVLIPTAKKFARLGENHR